MIRKHRNLESQKIVIQIHAETKRRGWTLHNTAAELGISHIYLASLTSGARKLSGLRLQKQRELACFLGITMAEFFLECGILRKEDFPESLAI